MDSERSLAHTPDGRPFFALFIYSDGQTVQLIHVIAGRKLATMTRDELRATSDE